MNAMPYAGQDIDSREITASIANMTIGFGILTLPRVLVTITRSSDAWISLVIGGTVMMLFTYVTAKLVSRFPRTSFLEMASRIAGKPVAVAITLLFALYAAFFCSFEVRGVGSIARIYLFDETPIEVICLVFLWIILYAVYGHSSAVIRLNVLFFPIIIFIVLVIIVLDFSFFRWDNMKPLFVASWQSTLKASFETTFSFLGFEMLLFYSAFVKRSTQVVKAALVGNLYVLMLYVVLFIFVIGVFGVDVASNTLFPTVELAKQVEIPGGFFERFESIFFTIWTMTLFNTGAVAFDVALLALESVFPRASRFRLMLVMAPVVYLFAMQPRNIPEMLVFGQWLGYFGILCALLIPSVLFLIAHVRKAGIHHE